MPSATRPACTWAEPAVGERLGLEVDVAEATRPIERQLGVGQQHRRVVDVAAHRRHRHPTLLDARRLVDRPAAAPGRTTPARR